MMSCGVSGLCKSQSRYTPVPTSIFRIRNGRSIIIRWQNRLKRAGPRLEDSCLSAKLECASGAIGFFPVACHSRGFPTGSKRDWKAHSYSSVSRKFVSLARLQLYVDEVAGKVFAHERIGLADLVLPASGSQPHRIAAVPVAPRGGVNVR